MIEIKKIDEIKSNAGLVIGNFDGVHLGHQALVQEIVASCKEQGLATILLTFDPHPQLVLTHKKNFLLCSPAEKRELLMALGIDYLMEVEFTRDFSDLLPSTFLNDYIFSGRGKFSVCKLFIGHDFTFGKNKAGDHTFVKNYCDQKKIDLEIEKEFSKDNIVISSSLIRKHLLVGDIETANILLGRNFSLKGRVIKGDGRGRKLGFPTANVQMAEELLIPSSGVYFTQTVIGKDEKKQYNSITNIGTNPTFKSVYALNVETNIFNFDQDIYGEEIKIFFRKKIRDEKKFNSSSELIAQISADITAAKEFFVL